MKWALVNSSNIVMNIIVYDGHSTFTPPSGLSMRQVNDWVYIGLDADISQGNVPVPTPTPAAPPPPVVADWSNISNKPSLFSGSYNDLTSRPNLFSGSYNDLSNKPSIPSVQVNSDWNASSGFAQILNKPTIPVVQPRVFSTPNFVSVTTAGQVSSTRDAEVRYSFPASITSIVGTQTITATLRYVDNAGMSTNVVTVSVDQLSIGGILNLSVNNILQLTGTIPAGKYRQVTFSVSGGASAPNALSSGQEVLQ